MARGRRPASTEPSRGTLASRAFRDRRKQEKIDLEREVSRLQRMVQSLEEENEALRNGEIPALSSSSSTSSITSTKRKARSAISPSVSTPENQQHLCSSCGGGLAETEDDEELLAAASDDPVPSKRRRSTVKSPQSTTGTRSASRSSASSLVSSSLRDESNSNESNSTSATDIKPEAVDGESSLLVSSNVSGFRPEFWNPPSLGFPFNNNTNDGATSDPGSTQRPHTSGGFGLSRPGGIPSHQVEPPISHLARLSQGQISHNPSFENPAFQFFFANQNASSNRSAGQIPQNIEAQPIQTYQTLGGSSIHPSPHGSSSNQFRRLWPSHSESQDPNLVIPRSNDMGQDGRNQALNGARPYSQVELSRSSSVHARSNSLGGNEASLGNPACSNVFGALDANSCCWGLLNCGEGGSR